MYLPGVLVLLVAYGMIHSVTTQTTVPIPNVNTTTQQETSLEDYLCTGLADEISSFTTFELSSDITHSLQAGKFCFLRDLSNITIFGAGERPAVIRCMGDYYSEIQTGFGFRNITGLSIRNIVFESCGGVISNESYAYGGEPLINAGELLQAVIVINNCQDVEIESLEITRYRGYGILGINVLGHSLVNSIKVHSSYSNLIGRNSSNLTTFEQSGSGTLFIYIDTVSDRLEVMPSDTKSNHTLVISSNTLVNNTNIYPDKFAERLDVADVLGGGLQALPLPVPGAGGLTIYILQLRFDISIKILDSEFSENIGTVSGGMTLIHKNSLLHSDIAIDNCMLRNNGLFTVKETRGAGMQIFFIFPFTVKLYEVSLFKDGSEDIPNNPITVTNTQFIGHKAMTGAGAYVYSHPQNISKIVVTFENVSFIDNEATSDGDCILAKNERSTYFSPSKLYLTLISVYAEGNGYNYEGVEDATSGAFTFINLAAAGIKGNKEHNTTIKDCESSAISAFDTNVILFGTIIFQNNTAPNGAAIKLQANSYLLLFEKADLIFYNNSAQYEGGAIYSQAASGTQCAIQFITDQQMFNFDSTITTSEQLSNIDLNVTFIDNQATSGRSLYLSQLYNCTGFPDAIIQLPRDETHNIYSKLFRFEWNNTKTSFLEEIRSEPVQPCFCSRSNKTVSCESKQSIEVLLGKSFSLSVVPVDNVQQPVESLVLTRLLNSGNTTFSDGSVIHASKSRGCEDITYSLIHEENKTIQLELSLVDTSGIVTADITILPCPIGFELGYVSGTCECIRVYRERGLACNIENGLITRPHGEWVGLVNYTGVSQAALTSKCPFSYCREKDDLREVNLTDPDSICLGNRTGELCGKCREGLSLRFGTNFCGECSNFYLFTILLYALAGILLVCILFVLKITISTGTINGLIFYAQIIGINMSLSENEETRIFTVFISLLNLDLGFPVCFYNGMTKMAELGLQFVFPAYIWLIVIGIIIATNYSSRLQKVFGNNICVNVLVTLLYLSYAKVVRTITAVFIPTFVSTDNELYYAWFFDGTVLYFTELHILLVIASIVMLVIFVIPYQLLLLFSTWCLKHSRLSYYLKPVIDANVAPFRDKMRFWLGFRLLFVKVQIIFSILLTANYYSLVIFFHFLMILVLTVAQAYLKPFKTNALNLLDLFFTVNLNLYFGTQLYLLTSSDPITIMFRTPSSIATEVVLVGSAMVVFFGIVFYHIWLVCNCNVKTKLVKRIADRRAVSDSQQPTTTTTRSEVEVSLDYLENSDGYVAPGSSMEWSGASNMELRESLLDD